MKKYLYRLTAFLTIFLILTYTFAQNRNIFTINGRLSSETGETSGASAEILQDGNYFESISINNNGRFSIDLEFEHEYTFIFSREDCFSKKIVVSTLVPEVILENNPDFPEFDIEQYLYSKIDGIDDSFSDNVVLRIFYDSNVDNFISEEFYNDTQVRAQIENAIQRANEIDRTREEVNRLSVEELNRLQEQYNNYLEIAAEHFTQGSYQEALEYYRNASQIFPEEQYPIDRIAEINDLIAAIQITDNQQNIINDNYNSIITEADRLFYDLLWNESKTKYNEALEIKPNEQYPKDQIEKIDIQLDYIANQSRIYDRYAQAIEDGDRFRERTQFLRAEASYEFALTFIPNDPVALQRLEDLNVFTENDRKYNQLISDADKSLKSEDYIDAKDMYQEASLLKPLEQYPLEKISEIEEILDSIQQTQQEYDNAIAQADTYFGQEQFQDARSGYQQAKSIKPEEIYPDEMIEKIDSTISARELIAQQQAEQERLRLLQEQQDREYAQAIEEADNFFQQQQYNEASGKYSDALEIKPEEPYPQQRIDEINNILVQIANTNQRYNEAISQADNAYQNSEYEEAKTKYNEALEIKPTEEYPKNQLERIEDILQEIARNQELEQNYTLTLSEADNLFNNEQYIEAITVYENALRFKPNEEYPAIQISLAREIIAENERLNARNQAYQNAITEADEAFDQQIYTVAEEKYNEALEIKPEESYPVEQLEKITIALELMKQEQYDQLISVADSNFEDEDYNESRKNYSYALNIFPNDEYASNRISEIERIVNEIAEAEAERRRIQQEYTSAINQADNAFELSQYDTAEEFYRLALSIKPNEEYPVEKIQEISDILEKQKIDEEYQEILIMADTFYRMTDYQNARDQYLEALNVKPEEQYPKDQIGKIDNILIETEEAILREEQIAQQNENIQVTEQDENSSENLSYEQYYNDQMLEAYQNNIEQGDQAFEEDEYNIARFYYQNALQIIPEEEYPQEKIDQIAVLINNRLTDRLEREYQQAIDNGDNALQQGELSVARSYYNSALTLKPNERYPRLQIDTIEERIEAIQTQQNTEEYNSTLEQADQAFAEGSYSVARFYYQQASTLNPGESYPKEQIERIQNILSRGQN